MRFILDPNVIIANLKAGVVDLNIGRSLYIEQGIQTRDSWPEGKLDLVYDSPGQPVPANIRNAAQVRVIGSYEPSARVFHAAQLYTKCPSKYVPGTYKQPGKL